MAFESSPKAPIRPLEPVQLDATVSQNPVVAPALVVDVRGVSLTFQTGDGEVQALSNVDLPIGAGDFVSFIGPSGCGKTTLLRVIADLEHPTPGTVLVNGVSSEQARLQRHYGYISRRRRSIPGVRSSATSRCRSRSWVSTLRSAASASENISSS